MRLCDHVRATYCRESCSRLRYDDTVKITGRVSPLRFRPWCSAGLRRPPPVCSDAHCGQWETSTSGWWWRSTATRCHGGWPSPPAGGAAAPDAAEKTVFGLKLVDSWRWMGLKAVMLKKKNRHIWIKVLQIKQRRVFSYLIQHNTFIVHAGWNLISLNGVLCQSSWGSNKYERLVRSCFSWVITLAAIWHLFSEYHSPKNAAFVLSAWIIVRGGLPLWSWRCDEQSSPELWAPGPSSAEVPRNLWRTT